MAFSATVASARARETLNKIDVFGFAEVGKSGTFPEFPVCTFRGFPDKLVTIALIALEGQYPLSSRGQALGYGFNELVRRR